jgi:hypothetical protein
VETIRQFLGTIAFPGIMFLVVAQAILMMLIYKRMAKHHRSRLIKIGTPIRINLFTWFIDPITRFKWASFLYNSEDYGDRKLKIQKYILKSASVLMVASLAVVFWARMYG